MIFGGFKGFQPHGGLSASLVTILVIVEAVGFLGYLSGMVGEDDLGEKVLRDAEWLVERIVYTVIMWIAYAIIMFMVLRSNEDSNLKFGACTLVSLPIVVFISFFFGLIELAPK